MSSSTSASLPPRLSTRLLLSLYGEQRCDNVNQLIAQRKKMLTEIDNADVTKSLTLDMFLYPSMSADITQKIKRTYMSFLKEVSAVEAGNNHPNAAKTMYSMIARNLSSTDTAKQLAAQREAVSYFGHISDAQFDTPWKLGEELQQHAVKTENETMNTFAFGHDIVFAPTDSVHAPPTWGNYFTLFDGADVFQSTREAVQGGKATNTTSTSTTSNNSAKPASVPTTKPAAQDPHAATRTWLTNLCTTHLSAHPHSVFDASQLYESLCKCCEQAGDDDGTLQMLLFDLVGEEGFELMLEVIQNKTRILDMGKAPAPPQVQQQVHTTATTSNASAVAGDAGVSAEDLAAIRAAEQEDAYQDQYPDMYGDSTTAEEGLSANQRRKRELKRAREMERVMQEGGNSGNYSFLQGQGADTGVHSVAGGGSSWLQQLGFDDQYLLTERSLGLAEHGTSSAANGAAVMDERWLDNLLPEGTKLVYEKRGLPAGTERFVHQGYEEVSIPATIRGPVDETALVDIQSNLEPWAQKAFAGTKRLNTIQSKVFPVAYHSFENMLVCAPTGAGKTNIAMLTLLQLINTHRDATTGTIDKAAIKAVYIAPMKALAQEVVTKFSERLKPLGIIVREYTGDMQLTKQEMMDAQVLVCTPEKYDVVTRKGGDKSLGTLVSLLIIDEVHLLADERGAVIETIVARTQRYVESSQRLVRIVGLSATLPNYTDVATFLRVNLKTGLHYFGPEYRPIPLSQCFIGVTEKQRIKRNDSVNKLAYDKMVEALKRGKQVMIFVHARKETSKTAEAMADLSGKFCTTDLLQNFENEHYTLWKRQVDKSRSKEVQQLFAKGLGVHHAGMLRADRTLTEQLFECGLVKVLCCTATLAWGINLPAHTVIIKGTELYDPERGGYVDLSMLDVLQIFGRAGRPQYDTSGHAVLITGHKSLSMYLGMLTNQAPIESALIKALPDHLNAEIVNGTVNNINEAAAWLSYTFLHVRMCKNPLVYGISYDTVYTDPRLEIKRVQLVTDAANLLDNCMMIRYDKRSGNLAVTNLGRIASHYYIRHGTIEAFNTMLSPHLNDVDALHVLCSSAEFDQLKVRPEELSELDTMKKHVLVSLRSAPDDTAGKVNILLQAYLNKGTVSSFTLQSDTNYVAQNAGRITRALFEICLKRGWSSMANHYLMLCKCIDRRMLPSHSALRQFNELPYEVLHRIEECGATPERLIDLDSREIGQLIHNAKLGARVLSLVHSLPYLSIDTTIQPITRSILRLVLTIASEFTWVDKYHGGAVAFWIWIEDSESEYIYHAEHVVVTKREHGIERCIEITIPIREPLPAQYYIRVVSDTWVGCEAVHTISFKDLVLPSMAPVHTDLLSVHPVPVVALKNAAFQALYPFSHFNPIQSQMFHVLYHTNNNVLVGAPTGSGKTITAELAILRLLRDSPGAKTIYVAPLKALARERLTDWQRKFGTGNKKGLGLHILELTGDVTPTMDDLNRADILIVTPEKWDSISRGWQRRSYVQRVQLVVIDEIHLLGVDRGPVLEVLVSRMRFISTQTDTPIRFVGLSTALANPRDLADWLGIGDIGVYNFRSAVRPVPLTTHIQGYPGKHYCPRMATMNKPAYAAIKEHSPHKPALIFVSSRRQTRLTALDLIAYCASDDNPKQFLHMDEAEIENITSTLQDRALRDTIVFGIALHHAGLHNHDRKVVEELFFAGKVQVLVCTSTLAWGVNLPCHLVIVKGTEFFDAKQCKYVDMPVTDVLQMMGRAGRPQFDETGVACIFVQEEKKIFYKKFLHEPFPVESSLHKQLHNHLNAEIATGSLHNVRDCIEYLSWTYYFRRLMMNPTYYGLVESAGSGGDGTAAVVSGDISAAAVEAHLVQLVATVSAELHAAGCIEIHDSDGSSQLTSTAPASANSVAAQLAQNRSFSCTYLGRIASLYYLNYRTVGMVRERLFDIDDEDWAAATAGPIAPSNKGRAKSVAAAAADEASHYKSRHSLWQLLLVLCDAPEFAELPVRHCEDELNVQLAHELCVLHHDGVTSPHSLCTFLSTRSTYDSAHCKAFLLLLAHFEGATLPISDYITDTKMVLDQVTRVLKAMVDIAAEEGLFDIVLRLMVLSQQLVQGMSSSTSELCQLPHIGTTEAGLLRSRGVTSVHQLQQLSADKARQLAVECLCNGNTGTNTQAGAQGQGGRGRRGGRGANNSGNNSGNNGTEYENSTKISEFLRVLGDLPVCEITAVRVRAVPAVPADMSQEPRGWDYECSSTTSAAVPPAPAPALVLTPGCSYELEVTLSSRRTHNNSNRTGQGNKPSTVYSKRPHKPKPPSWYLTTGLSEPSAATAATTSTAVQSEPVLKNVFYTQLMCNKVAETRGELLALKQVSANTNTTSSTVSVRFEVPVPEPGGAGNKHISVVVACDAIMGVDVAVNVPVVFSSFTNAYAS